MRKQSVFSEIKKYLIFHEEIFNFSGGLFYVSNVVIVSLRIRLCGPC